MKTAFLLSVVLALGPGRTPSPGPSTYSSHLMVDQEVVISARITGIVDQVLVDRGSVVKKGQPLANLDSREADADVRQTKEDMELKKTQFDRAQSLTTSEVGSKADLDEKRALYGVSVAAYEKAKTLRDYTVIRAPFDGVVTDKYIRVGQKVVDIGKEPLFKVTALEPLLARVYVSDRDISKIRRGDAVEVVPRNSPNVRASGRVEYISPTVDAGSETVEVIVRVRRDASPSILRPGVAVEIRFPSLHRP